MLYKTFFTLSIACSLVACGGGGNKPTDPANHTQTDPHTTATTPNHNNNTAAAGSKTMYAAVEKLRVRKTPDLKGDVIAELHEGESFTFLGERSPNKIKANMRGVEVEDNFLKIRTAKGAEGWVFGGGASEAAVTPQPYKVAIAFCTLSMEKGEISDDWTYYLNDLTVHLEENTDIQFIYSTDKFNAVPIKNAKGDIIGEENISGLVKKHKVGVAVVEKGREMSFVEYDTDMITPTMAYFNKKK